MNRNFTGQTEDTTPGLYDFLFRQQSQSQGRWLVPDPAGLAAVDLTNPQTWNRYAYVASNPLNATDPLGLYKGDSDGDFVTYFTPGVLGGGRDCGLGDCGYGGGGWITGGGIYVDGTQSIINSSFLGSNGQAPCPNNTCDGFANGGEYFRFVAGAGGATGYIKFSDLTQGINEWNGTFYSNAQFQSQIINPAVDSQRWALAKAIAAQNGKDVNSVYQQLTYINTVGGNSEFNPGDIDLSFLNPNQDYRGGDVHLHPDGLIHLDTFNPFSSFPLGALGHFFVDMVIGNINSSVPFPR